MRMHLEGVKNPQITLIQIRVICGCVALPITAPAAIVVPISIALASATVNIVPVAVAVATIAPEDTRETGIAIRSPAIPTAITGVVAINKLRTFLIQVRGSAPASLAHGVGRHPDDHQQTQH